MLIRIFTGAGWAASTHVGDYAFDALPDVGQLLAIDDGGDWRCGEVLAIAHRITSPREAADIAMLLGTLVTGPVDAPLPLDLLDEVGGTGGPAAASAIRGPWAG